MIRVVLLLGLALTACSSGSSGTCSGTSATCTSATELEFCDSTGTKKTITCKGPQGCSGKTCDTSTHTAGDGCFGGSQCDGVMTSRVLSCVAGQLRAFRTCSGPRQCFVENGAVGCDVTVGDTCPAAYEARYFCDSIDSQQVVKCADGGFVLYSKCSGAKNCAQGDGGLLCQ